MALRLTFLVLATLAWTGPLLADNALHPGAPVLDRPTLTALGVQLPITGDDNFNASVTVRYRVSGTTAWTPGLPLFRVHPEASAPYSLIPQFAGSILDLLPATTYDVELHSQDPDGPVDQTVIVTATTRSVPSDPATPRTVSVTDLTGLNNALRSAQPGDIITLADGIYNVGTVFFFGSGTANNPIVIRGASQDGTILDGGNCSGCNVLEVYGSYVHIERLTLQNAERALRFYNQTVGNVVRRVHVKNTILGIHLNDNQLDYYIADNVLEGRLPWPQTYASDGAAHAADDGIVVHGFGHVVCHNRISGYADGLQINQFGSRAIDFYGNDIIWSYDNAIEMDTSEGNTRAFRNRITNGYDPLSVQPVLGGPVYMLRNIVVNTVDEQMKFHALGTTPPQQPNGVLAYHNTFVSPTIDLNMCTPDASHHFRIENNLFIGPATLNGNAVMWCGPVDDGLFDYNGYWPDGRFSYNLPVGTGYAYSNWLGLSAVQLGGIETHGALLPGQILASGLIGPPDYTVRYDPQDVTLALGSSAIDRGTVLPNVNDGFTGIAPDLGAQELGCPAPVYGPRPAGMDETNEPVGCMNASFKSIRVNAGGGTYSDPSTGVQWSADYGFNSGSTTYTLYQTVTNTTTSELYQTQRLSSGTLQYQFDGLPAGAYIVKLKFAEINSSGPGTRVFNIALNGQTVQSNFEIAAYAGGALKAVDLSYPVTVTGTQIVLQLIPVVGNPAINAIEIVSGASAPAAWNIAAAHSKSFMQGQTGTYTVTVARLPSPVPPNAVVTVTEMPPLGLNLVSMGGPGWSCAGNNCSRTDSLNPGASYSPITVGVSVATNAPALVSNQAILSVGGLVTSVAADATTIARAAALADLSIGLSHVGSFTQGQFGATYTITVANPGSAGTSGTTTVVDTLPAGLTFVSGAGDGFTCSGVAQVVTCIHPASIPGGGSANLTIMVNVGSNAISVTNTATVTNADIASDANDTAIDPTTISTGPVPDGTYQLRYLTNLDKGDSHISFSNAGTVNGFDPAGRICVNVYAFDPAEEMISCCACVITPNGLASLSARNDLIGNTLTPGAPSSLTVKLVSNWLLPGSACNAGLPNAPTLARGIRAWANTLHLNTSVSPRPGSYQHTETPFSIAELSDSELSKLSSFCAFIQANGSGAGICSSCRSGALGADSR